jgi:proteasome assembly chaperone (PAC2) family protein
LKVLTASFEEVVPLNRPVMVLALRGLFDVAEVATDAIETLTSGRVAPVVAAIDPDPFFDFTIERPQAEFDDDGERTICWPENEFQLLRGLTTHHDVVVLAGVEPHLRLSTFADTVALVARELGCEIVVTLGASPEPTPHTRPPRVVGSSTNPGLIRALGLSRPQYQGVTGLVGVLQERLDRYQLPAVSLRVGVPHYLGNAKHPQASIALLRHLELVLGMPTVRGVLDEEAARWRSLHDEAVAEDQQAARYVEMLEREYDRRVEATLAAADDLAAQLEQFLREQGDDDEKS